MSASGYQIRTDTTAWKSVTYTSQNYSVLTIFHPFLAVFTLQYYTIFWPSLPYTIYSPALFNVLAGGGGGILFWFQYFGPFKLFYTVISTCKLTFGSMTLSLFSLNGHCMWGVYVYNWLPCTAILPPSLFLHF